MTPSPWTPKAQPRLCSINSTYTHVRDSIQGNDSPTVKKDAVVKKDAKKPSVRDSVRAAVHKSVAAHVAKATKVHDAIKKALTPKDK